MTDPAIILATAAAPLPRRQRWGTVWLLCLGMIIAYIDRVNLLIAVADQSFNPLPVD